MTLKGKHDRRCLSRHPGCLCMTCSRNHYYCCIHRSNVVGVVRDRGCNVIECCDYDREEVPADVR